MSSPEQKSISVTDREFGALEQELKDLKHKLRNLQAIISLSGIGTMTKDDVEEFKRSLSSSVHHSKDHSESIEELQKRVFNLTDELTKIKIKIYTAFSVIAVLFSAVIWLVDLAFKFIDKA